MRIAQNEKKIETCVAYHIRTNKEETAMKTVGPEVLINYTCFKFFKIWNYVCCDWLLYFLWF